MKRIEIENSANGTNVNMQSTLTTTTTTTVGLGTRFRIATAVDYQPFEQAAQLTVSSVNTILEDLPETDDEDDERPRPPLLSTKSEECGGGDASTVNPTKGLKQIVAGPAPLPQAGGDRRTRHPSDSALAGASARPRGQRQFHRRERSPVVSFADKPATVIESKKFPPPRPRSRSDATRFIKFRSSPTSSVSSNGGASPPVAGDGDGSGGGGAGGGKMAWLRERRRSVQKIAFGAAPPSAAAELPSEEAGCGRDELVAALESSMSDHRAAAATRGKLLKGRLKSSFDRFDRPTKTMRPRTKSDKFDRAARKKPLLAEVSKSAAFDWPLGRLGKLRQKYSNQRALPKSASEVALTEAAGGRAGGGSVPPPPSLKRHNSERNKRRNTLSGGGGVVRARSVAFEEPSFAQSLWKSSVKFILEKTSGNRKRHHTDPCKASN